MSWSITVPWPHDADGTYVPERSALPAPEIFDAIRDAEVPTNQFGSDAEQLAVAKECAIKVIESRVVSSPDDHYAVTMYGHKNRPEDGGSAADALTVSVYNRPNPVPSE